MVGLAQCALGSWEVLLTPAGYWANWCNLINPPSSYPLAHTIFPGEICHSLNKYQLTAVMKRCLTRSKYWSRDQRCNPCLYRVWSPGGKLGIVGNAMKAKKRKKQEYKQMQFRQRPQIKQHRQDSHLRLHIRMLLGVPVSVLRDLQLNKNTRSRRKRLIVECVIFFSWITNNQTKVYGTRVLMSLLLSRLRQRIMH